MTAQSICSLCSEVDTTLYEFAHARRYRRCKTCELIFMEAAYHLQKSEERKRYELHNNNPNDPAYRAHLSNAVAPLTGLLEAGSCGLDFGSGPGPTASLMLEEAGFKTHNYDPFFAPKKELLEHRYDFVICTETAEHFRSPGVEFELIDKLLLPGAYLSLMTSLSHPQQLLADWWYAKDPTHVSFYSLASLEWIACNWRWKIIASSDCVSLFLKEG